MSKRSRRVYTDEQRAEALTRINLYGGNVNRVARELEIPRGTLMVWRATHNAAARAAGDAIAERGRAEGTDHAAILSRVIVAAAERLLELLPAAENPREAAVALGIAVDKFLDITQGRRGHTVNVDARSVQLGAGLSDDDRRALLASAIGQAAGDAVAALPPPAGLPATATDAFERD